MTAAAMDGLSSYALEVLELTPLWRYRARSSLGSGALQALPEPHRWWSVSTGPLGEGLREAVRQAAALAMGPLALPALAFDWRLGAPPPQVPVAAESDEAPGVGRDTHGVSLDLWQDWLSAQMQGQASVPGVVLVWGAGFATPLAVPYAEETVWCVGLPEAAAALRAEARRQIWATLLGLREALR